MWIPGNKLKKGKIWNKTSIKAKASDKLKAAGTIKYDGIHWETLLEQTISQPQTD